MRYLPAEWHEQSFVQITWPDEFTDWASILDEVVDCYKNIVREIAKREPVVVVTRCRAYVTQNFPDIDKLDISIYEMPINDTWARDHGFITVIEDGKPVLLDFQFNGWGLKFASYLDNLINRTLFGMFLANAGAKYENHLSTVFEGGSIESDGEGTLMTTSECLLSPNRNGAWNRQYIESHLLETFGAKKLLWLDNGYLAGDDTDSHIDTLARFAPKNTIMYVKCDNESDEHYKALKQMESNLQQFTNAKGEPYTLVALPMCSPIFDDEERIPATYANFLFVNNAVLVPIYGIDEDEEALNVFKNTFSDIEVVPINCSSLIKQHGSLHCATMQFPKDIKIQ